MASTSVVLPWSTWATIATLRRSARDWLRSCGVRGSLPVGVAGAPSQGRGSSSSGGAGESWRVSASTTICGLGPPASGADTSACTAPTAPGTRQRRQRPLWLSVACGSLGAMSRTSHPPCAFVPPYLLRRLAEQDARRASHARARRAPHRSLRRAHGRRRRAASDGDRPGLDGAPARRRTDLLPGEPVRARASPGRATWRSTRPPPASRRPWRCSPRSTAATPTTTPGRRSSRPSTTAATTTTRSGTARQLVFGDGDGASSSRFTKPVDVLGHEFTHAVTEHTAGLVYQGQSGALNESVVRRLRRLPQAATARPGRRRRPTG